MGLFESVYVYFYWQVLSNYQYKFQEMYHVLQWILPVLGDKLVVASMATLIVNWELILDRIWLPSKLSINLKACSLYKCEEYIVAIENLEN